MAHHARHLVLRNVPAASSPLRVPTYRRPLPLPLQLLLQHRRPSVAPPRSRTALAPNRGTPTATMSTRPYAPRAGLRRSSERDRAGAHARNQPRAAASGAPAHRYQIQPAINPLRPAYHNVPIPRGAGAPGLHWLEYGDGIVQIGHDERGFAFDNEWPRPHALLQAHRIASRLATAGDYLAFMDDSGYKRYELWLSQG
jgi:hypothetical protein